MKNTLNRHCRKLVVPSYLLAQLLVALTVKQLHVNSSIHFGLLFAVSIVYLALAIKDPGYVDYQPLLLKQDQKKRSLETNPPNKPNQDVNANFNNEEKKLDVIIQQKLSQIGELGIQSCIKVQEKSEPQKEKSEIPQQIFNFDPHIIEGEIGLSLVTHQPSKFTPMPQVLKKVQRHCSICHGDQDLRVRHCIDCGRCVSTFDHHCPWINNCIGEKNKVYLLLFLMLQEAQFFGLAIDLVLNMDKGITREAIVLWISVVTFGLVLLGVLLFHLYMTSINLTTWQKLRWYRIEYLMIFSKGKMRSLFDRGVRANLSVFLRSSCSRQSFDWKEHFNPQSHEFVNEAKNSSTQRRLNNDKMRV